MAWRFRGELMSLLPHIRPRFISSSRAGRDWLSFSVPATVKLNHSVPATAPDHPGWWVIAVFCPWPAAGGSPAPDLTVAGGPRHPPRTKGLDRERFRRTAARLSRRSPPWSHG